MRKKILVCLIFFSSLGYKAQTLNYSQNVLKHYSSAYLDSLRQSDFGKFSYLIIQYTVSFKMDTTGHVAGTYEPSYLTGFDIKEYEHNRLYSDRFVRDYDKYGFKLTLMSVKEMNDLVSFFIQNPVFIDYLDSKAPIYVNTGNTQVDQLTYRRKNEVWHRVNL